MSLSAKRSSWPEPFFEILARTADSEGVRDEVDGGEQAEEKKQSRGLAEKDASLLSWLLRCNR